jgi:non-canonical purine NTP pyrophosphatase (RdgB/HAM1 family)
VTDPLRVVLATGNAGKAREFSRLLGPVFSVEALPDGIVMPVETGQTFAANARLKAEAVAKALGGSVVVLADDSGLEVAILGGRPGVLSARFAGEVATDRQNVTKLLDEMSEASNRTARFVCSLCLVLPEALATRAATESVEVEGVLEGDITLSPRGTDGFGYDPVFLPVGWPLTLAEAAPTDKDGVSHRGAASRALLARLAELKITGTQGV